MYRAIDRRQNRQAKLAVLWLIVTRENAEVHSRLLALQVLRTRVEAEEVAISMDRVPSSPSLPTFLHAVLHHAARLIRGAQSARAHTMYKDTAPKNFLQGLEKLLPPREDILL